MTMNVLEMATAVLKEIGEVAEGVTPSAADLAFVKSRYNYWRRNAETRELVDWYADDEEIPDGAELGVIYCVAEEVFTNFSATRSRDWKTDGEAYLHDYCRDRVPSRQTQMVNM